MIRGPSSAGVAPTPFWVLFKSDDFENRADGWSRRTFSARMRNYHEQVKLSGTCSIDVRNRDAGLGLSSGYAVFTFRCVGKNTARRSPSLRYTNA